MSWPRVHERWIRPLAHQRMNYKICGYVWHGKSCRRRKMMDWDITSYSTPTPPLMLLLKPKVKRPNTSALFKQRVNSILGCVGGWMPLPRILRKRNTVMTMPTNLKVNGPLTKQWYSHSQIEGQCIPMVCLGGRMPQWHCISTYQLEIQ